MTLFLNNPGNPEHLSYHRNFAAGTWPEEVFVTLKNGAHSAWGSRLAGKFIKQAGETNGRPFWLKDDAAIWYDDSSSKWAIGAKKNLGTSTCGMHSTTEAPDPVGLRWKYTDGENWIDAEEEDVQVQPATEGKLIKGSCPNQFFGGELTSSVHLR